MCHLSYDFSWNQGDFIKIKYFIRQNLATLWKAYWFLVFHAMKKRNKPEILQDLWPFIISNTNIAAKWKILENKLWEFYCRPLYSGVKRGIFRQCNPPRYSKGDPFFASFLRQQVHLVQGNPGIEYHTMGSHRVPYFLIHLQ